jgi:flagellar motility protein MotE (MotC chaperone)
MKKLFSVIMITLALNFLAAAAGVGWLWQSGKLDKDKVHAIKEIVFPATQASTQPTDAELAAVAATTRPTLKLEELLAKQAGRPATEQVAFMQTAFDAQMRLLDRRAREIADLQLLVEQGEVQLVKDRAALEAEKTRLKGREEETAKLQQDKGFQDSLELYKTMVPKQVKEIFMKLDDAAVVRYLQAMEPRAAGKIIKEFKTPDELARVQTVLEKIRQAEASAKG